MKLAKETDNSQAELVEYPMQDFEQEQKSRGFLENEDAQKDMHRMLYHFIENQFYHGELLQKLQKKKDLKSAYSYQNKVMIKKEIIPVDDRIIKHQLLKNDCLNKRNPNNWSKP